MDKERLFGYPTGLMEDHLHHSSHCFFSIADESTGLYMMRWLMDIGSMT
jgi:hypothetical protein